MVYYNQSDVLNTSFPDLELKYCHNSISYHAVRWAAVARKLQVLFEKLNGNMVDLLTKNLDKVKH